jgi:UDP-2,3-diacylglucosamine hydrolase
MTAPAKSFGPLGIIAGGGALPLSVARRAQECGHAPYILGFHGLADPGISEFAHDWMRWGEVGRMLRLLRKNGCEQIVIVGSVRRPRLTSLRIDTGLLRHARQLYQLTRGGDDAVLSRVVRFFEQQGFRVRGAHEIADDLTAPAGKLTRVSPRAADQVDMTKALGVLRALGPHDVGQAAVAARGYVLAVEAAEGTDEMLRRCAGLRQWGLKHRHGVLVKIPKPGQELRVDMPTIGPRTVELAAEAGLAGIGVAAGLVLLADSQELVESADRRGLFVVGLSDGVPMLAEATDDRATGAVEAERQLTRQRQESQP